MGGLIRQQGLPDLPELNGWARMGAYAELVRHRARRLKIGLRARFPVHLGGDEAGRTEDPRRLARRQYDYLRSRLAELHRAARIYNVVEIRRIDRPDGAGNSGAGARSGMDTDTGTRPGTGSGMSKGYGTGAFKNSGAGTSNRERAVWELTLAGPPGRVHESGDTLLVRWSNPPELVEEILRLLGEDGSRRYSFITHTSVFQPGRIMRLPLREILTHHLELYVAAPALLRTMNIPTEITGEAAPGRGVALEDVLRGARTVTARELIRLQPRITARAYSFSRIEGVPTGVRNEDRRRHPGKNDTGGPAGHLAREQVQILVSAVTTPVRKLNGTLEIKEGRATAFFRRHWEAQRHASADAGTDADSDTGTDPGMSNLQAWSLRHPWRLTRHTTDGNRPLIIIVTGTGVAGALCHLRILQASRSKPRKPLWMIYGVRNWKTQGLYQEELETHRQEGRITRLDVAESRPIEPWAESSGDSSRETNTTNGRPLKKPRERGRRVTDVIDEHDEEIARFLCDGADLFVSGTRAMGTAVRNRIVRIMVEQQISADADSARNKLATWEKEGRAQFSVS